MTDRLRVLALDANGYSRKEVTADTLLQGVLRFDYEQIPRRFRELPYVKNLKHRYDALGYIVDWREALCASPALDVDVCNTTNLIEYRRYLRRVAEYDVVIVLHSAAGDDLTLLQRAVPALSRRCGPLVAFIGNEFDLLDEKIGFLVEAGADFVCSQLPVDAARWLYAECRSAKVLPMPHALNPAVYYPPVERRRPLDIGFAGAFYTPAIGDVERTALIEALSARADEFGVRCEVRRGTVPRMQWAGFLRSTHGTAGAESGTYFLDRHAEILGRAREHLTRNPGATFDELYDECFAEPQVEFVSGKCISSRHFEAIGTRTCQILVEGKYNDILEPEVHYIAVRKDLSDLEDAVSRFKDEAYRTAIAERVLQQALDEHTYARRVESLVAALGA